MKYPAREHARRTAETYQKLFGSCAPAIVVHASKTQLWPDCDQTVPLRQDRYFSYLSGAWDLPDAAVLYSEKKLTLYLPPIDSDDVMWSGMPLSLEEAQEKYDVDEVKYIKDLGSDCPSSARTVPSQDGAYKGCAQVLAALDETRMIKDDFELDLMRKASAISDKSHLAVMSALPIEQNEGHIHAEFIYHCMRQGAKSQAYDSICGAGPNAGTLHYVKNDQSLDGRLLVLIDAGAEWQNYASDCTRVFPISGEWTKECREIYELVHEMQAECFKVLKAGAHWDELHVLSHRVLIRGLLKLGILHNGTEDEIFESRISTAFYPHGLGHMLGLNTHDTAGKADYNDKDPMMRYLRIRRPLEENMVVTVEPGCYFNKFLLQPHLAVAEVSKYINHSVLDKYWTVGGVRIEDDVRVLKDGFENFTKVTSDPDEISAIVKKGIERGRQGFHCVV